MSSERFNVQIVIEHEIGCANPSDLAANKAHFKIKIESLVVNENLSTRLREGATSDTSKTFFKAALSIVEAIDGISLGTHSWSIVKLYYSIFYLLRCKIATKNCYFFKCAGNIYSINESKGSKPILRSKGKFLGADIRGDHKTILATYITDFGAGDPLLSNKIGADSEYVFQWIMGARENIHYRNPTFIEPDLGHFDAKLFSSQNLSFWIDKYYSEAVPIHCFLEDHACLATPLILMRDTLRRFVDEFEEPPLTQEQADYLQLRLARIFDRPNSLSNLLETAFFA
jgi:hypothetical protein